METNASTVNSSANTPNPTPTTHPASTPGNLTVATPSMSANGDNNNTDPHPNEEDSRLAMPASVAFCKTTAPPIVITEANAVTQKDFKAQGGRSNDDCTDFDTVSHSPRLRSSRTLKTKSSEVLGATRERKRPLHLLDLPMDILKDIVKEVTHTNDLTSLALCHSALHKLTLPHIYSRFDIVWPDSGTNAEPRSGVDALTYGLATLVMAEEVFEEAPWQQIPSALRPSYHENLIRRRRGNHYALYTRKFSLGNGPPDWVSEYLIGKEGGKMLGTLVALAVARMHSLETFIWDMPTGVLRDVWLALSSLGDRDRGPCQLQKVWVRWHDNSGVDAMMPIHPTSGMLGSMLHTQIPFTALDRVEHPSFSVLPPLKSLSVLDIDELAYLDEMAVLIGRSYRKLRELRLGVARHAIGRDWVTVWEGEGVNQIDRSNPTTSLLRLGEKRLGGVLGVLTGMFCDLKQTKPSHSPKRGKSSSAVLGRERRQHSIPDQVLNSPVPLDPTTTSSILNDITSLRDVLPDVPTTEPGLRSPPSALQTVTSPSSADQHISLEPTHTSTTSSHTPESFDYERSHNKSEEANSDDSLWHQKLQLENFELERVPLSIIALRRAIDWTKLTSLTLLSCQNHEHLWKMLRRSFAPIPRHPTHAARQHLTSYGRNGKAPAGGHDDEFSYPLCLKKLHVNTVSTSLIALIRDALAPNSLQTLFLQQSANYNSSVSIDTIFKGVLKRHRSSLTKLLIDSSEKSSDGRPDHSSRWKKWMLSRSILTFITSGKMPALRELGATLDYRDWHFFLQRLPLMPQIRSLYIPSLADHPHGNNADAKELALQIMDIVALRPEVELCYMGIDKKCFEILENKRNSIGHNTQAGPGGSSNFATTDTGSGHDPDLDVDEVDDDDGETDEMDAAVGVDDDEEEQDAGGPVNTNDDTDDIDDDEDGDDDEEEDYDGGDSDSDSSSNSLPGVARLRLREILYYDDKVSIFKARHGKL